MVNAIDLVPPLMAVDFVCRYASVELAGVTDVVELISDFIDYACLPYWSVPRALEKRDLRLMKRVAAREPPTMDPHHKSFLFDQALVLAMRLGDATDDNVTTTASNDECLEMVQWLCAYSPFGFVLSGMEEAARRGKLNIMEWLIENHKFIIWKDSVAGAAAENGHLEVLQWLLEREVLSVQGSIYATESAAEHGHLEIVEWVISCQGVIAEGAIVSAIAGGHFEIAKQLICYFEAYESPVDGIALLCTAAANNHLNILQWLYEHLSLVYTTAVLNSAASNGHLEIVLWLLANHPMGFNESTIDTAAGSGHLQIVELLHGDQTKHATSNAMDKAAANGHLEVVQWLHAHRSEGCSTAAMDQAAQNGHLEIVQWLHENREEGCTFRAMNGAASHGHMEILQWLHENREEGCTLMAMTLAAAYNHLDIVKWLHANRHEGCAPNAAVVPAERGHLEVLTWFHANDVQVKWSSDEMDAAGTYEVLQWLHTTRNDGCTSQAMARAASNNDFLKMLFVRKHYPELEYPRLAAEQALRSEHVEMVMWLYANYPDQVDVPQLRIMSQNSHHWRLVLEFLEPTPVDKEAAEDEPTPVVELPEVESTPVEELPEAEPTPAVELLEDEPTPVVELLEDEPTPVEEL